MKEGRATHFIVDFGAGWGCKLALVGKESSLLKLVAAVPVVVNLVVRVGFCRLLVRMPRRRRRRQREKGGVCAHTVSFPLKCLFHSGYRLGEKDLLGCHCAVVPFAPGDGPGAITEVSRQR